ncbi:TonB-dependent receptor [Piscinibacter defluvii]|uniref:TonB-dependent receptor n=1 Tax=Piscinibacter defluvii TaxID=1796922 RepID=UPI000FDDAC91|nr:TonB-dependent receptor [Piscinibacter defluvii]
MTYHLPVTAVALAAASLLVQAQTAAPAAPAAAASAPETTLPAVTVSASADASAGGLTAPYAGGQVARGGRVGVLGSQDLMDTPFHTTSYTQTLIQDQQATSIGDVLRNDPGVRIARGFGNYQQVYLVRGLPVFSDDVAYNGLYGLLPRQVLAAELVERVEVLRGASAFLNGAAPGGSGLGGSINVVPKRAPNEALTTLTLGADSGGQGQAAADIARRFGPDRSVGLRLNAVRRDGRTEVENETHALSLVALGLDYRGALVRVSADLGWQDLRLHGAQPSVTFGAGVPILAAPEARRNVGQAWTASTERDTFGTLRAELDLAPDWTLWAAYGQRRGDESNDLANPTVVDAAGTLNFLRFAGTRRDRIATGELGVRGTLKTGAVGHALVLSAARYRAKTNAPFDFSDFAGVSAGTLHAPVAFDPPALGAFPGETISDTKTASLAAADTLALLDDTLRLTLGARHQRIEDGAYDRSRVTPVLGAVVRAGRSLSLYATYVEGLVKGDTAPAQAGGAPVVNAGEVFAPYRTRQTEVGVKLDAGRVGATLSVFQARKPIYGVDAQNRFTETDRQRNRGLELSVYGEPAAGWRLLGGASRLDTDVGGKQAIGAPKTQFNLGTEWDLPAWPDLALNARVLHTAAQFADAANTQGVPAWTRLDIGARYLLALGAQQVALRARIDNVADRSYWASAGGYPGAGYLVLGTPRTFVLSGSVDF